MTHDHEQIVSGRATSGPEFDAMLARARSTVVAATVRRPRWPRHLASLGAAVALFGLGTATGVAAAGIGVDDETHIGSETITVPAPERASSLLRVTFTCLDEGAYVVSVAGAPNGTLEGQCDGSGKSFTSFDFMIPTDIAVQYIDVTMPDSARYGVQAEYRGFIGDDYPRNAAGQAFGRPEPGALNYPELLLVIGKDDDDASIRGYVETVELDPPTDLIGPALAQWTVDFRKQYPEGKALPLYESDGTTVIGTYRLTW